MGRGLCEGVWLLDTGMLGYTSLQLGGQAEVECLRVRPALILGCVCRGDGMQGKSGPGFWHFLVSTFSAISTSGK